VFLVHGESEPLEFYRQKLKEEGFENIVIPNMGDEFELR
jgi:hypothetical protein